MTCVLQLTGHIPALLPAAGALQSASIIDPSHHMAHAHFSSFPARVRALWEKAKIDSWEKSHGWTQLTPCLFQML